MKKRGKEAVHHLPAVSFGLAAIGLIGLVSSKLRKAKLHSLGGKVVLITGGSRGLGLALAEEFGRRGAFLALAARDAQGLESARELLLQRNAVKSNHIPWRTLDR